MLYEKDMELREICRTLKRHWVLILLMTLMITAVVAGFNFLMLPPLFEAKTSLIIGQDRSLIDQRIQSDMVVAYQKLMKTYSEIVLSKRIANTVALHMNGRITAEQIQKTVSVSPPTDTPILVIKIRWPNPAEAVRVLTMLSQGLIEESLHFYPGVNIQVMDEPEAAPKPVQPKKPVNIALGFLVGFIFSSGVVFFREALDVSFNTRKEIEQSLGIPVIGIIPKGHREGRP